jgi:K+-sensing histidine kinase KdpD
VNFELQIQDFGCGIPENKLESLFINFNKIDKHSKRNKFGVGLGLSICKSLIEQMAGSVAIETEVGKGTTWFITFKTICLLDLQHSMLEFRKSSSRS